MRILLVCESSHINESGGRVVRYITKILNEGGNQVKLVVLSEKRDDYGLGSFYKDNDVAFLPIPRGLKDRMKRLFFRDAESRMLADWFDKHDTFDKNK